MKKHFIFPLRSLTRDQSSRFTQTLFKMAEVQPTQPVQEVKEPPVAPAAPSIDTDIRPGTSNTNQDPGSPSKGVAGRKVLDEEYFYPENHLKKKYPESKISAHLSDYHWCSGMDSFKRNNVKILSDDEIIFTSGSTYHIMNIDTQERRTFHATDEDGVGAIAVHPERKFFAVGEKGKPPHIFIYEYPSLKLYRILDKGGERGFSCISWSTSGNRMASVATAPDYTITVWDWLQERVILKSKAWGQPVYSVIFSPTYDEQIITCGTMHIRFWKMAKTFTGLKLQGDIGKFGQIQLSDIAGFAELPDGKVLSGTEYGNLLLWDGNLIKALLHLPDGSPCHDGQIENVVLKGDEFITTGTDGYIKWWDFQMIDLAEAEEGYEVPVECKKSVFVGTSEEDNARILSLVEGNGFNIIYDSKGRIWKTSEDFTEQKVILSYHAGKIMDTTISPEHNIAITIGEDCTTRMWDIINKEEIYSQSFLGEGTCVAWEPPNQANHGRVVCTGFANGMIRLLFLGEDKFEVLDSLKVHDAPVKNLQYTPDGLHLVSVAEDNTLFFFDIAEMKLNPVCITHLDEQINDLKWHPEGVKVILGFQSGKVGEIERPDAMKLDTAHSYEVGLPVNKWTMKMMEFQIPEEEEDENAPPKRPEEIEVFQEWEPAPIASATYDPNNPDTFICSVDAPFNGYLYVCKFDEERPIRAIETSETQPKSIQTSKNFLMTTHEDGSIRVHSNKNPDKNMQFRPHDGNSVVRNAYMNHNESYVVSCAEDGTFYVSEIWPEEIMEAAELPPNTKKQPQRSEVPKKELGAGSIGLDNKLPFHVPIIDDEVDPEEYSLQMDKLKTDEDKKKRLADAKKDKKRQEIAKLRAKYEEIQLEQSRLDEKFRLDPEEMRVDTDYYEILLSRNEDLMQDVTKEVAWNDQYHVQALDNYKEYFINQLSNEKFTLTGLRAGVTVTSFRITKKSEFLSTNLETIQQLMEEERETGRTSGDENLMSPGKDSLYRAIGDMPGDAGEETKTDFRGTAQRPGAGPKKPGQKLTLAQQAREERTTLREQRKAGLAALNRQKPSDDAYDPIDNHNIQIALETMGDFKLKTDKNYVVPEDLIVNATKKRRQMFLLQESVFNLKTDFNSRLFGLRELKERLIKTIKQCNCEIEEINTELEAEEVLVTPGFISEEWPENYYKVSSEDVETYVREKQEAEDAAAANPFGAGASPVKGAESEGQDLSTVRSKETTSDKQSAQSTQRDITTARRMKAKGVTQREQDQRLHHNQKLENKKMELLAEIEQIVSGFDEAVRTQKLEKYKLESDLKQTDMKLVTYFLELLILDSLESEDNELTEKMSELKRQKAAIMTTLNDINKQFENMRKEVEETEKKREQIYSQFHEIIPDNNPNHDFLLKVLDKKVKRKKHRKNEDESDFSDEDEDDLSDLSDSEDEEDQQLEVCPPDCDVNLFESVQALRDNRIDLAEEAEDRQQQMVQLRQQSEEEADKEKKIDARLLMTDEEIKVFQREKMKRLNELQVAIALSLEQLQHLSEGTLSSDLSDSVLFTGELLDRLRHRIVELKKEKADTRLEKKKLEADEQHTKKDIDKISALKAEAQKKYDDIQALKFGHKINLDYLGYAEPGERLDKLKEQFETLNKESVKKIEIANKDLQTTKEDLTRVTGHNTKLLKKITELKTDMDKFETQLNEGTEHILEEDNEEERKAMQAERAKMTELLNLQAREIETLKTEINLFRRKGGHIYTKITANRRANID